MRQNIKDISPKFISSGDKTLLKYGLSINIDLGGFSLDKINLENDLILTDIEGKEDVKILPFKRKHILSKPKNQIEEFHLNNVQNGLVIRIDKSSNKTLFLNNIIKTLNSLQHIVVLVEKNSKIDIVDFLDDHSTKENGFNSKFVEIKAEEASEVNYFHIQNISKEKIHYSKKIAFCKENSVVNWIDLALGSKICITNTFSELEGESSKSIIENIFFSNNKQQFDISGQAIHNAKNTFSNVVAKGAIKDKSKTLYKGNIHIGLKAYNSVGNQRADMMLLDKESEADAIPQLLIDNNDVKCSHAVAIGRIDEEKLFYLMSRGLNKEESRYEIIKGFFESSIDRIKIKRIKSKLIDAMEEKMLR